jgi:hypothetical protein
MNEMDLLARLREEVPPRVSPHAEHLFRTGIKAPLAERSWVSLSRNTFTRSGPAAIRLLRPRWRLALIATLACGLVAGAVVVAAPPAQPTLTVKLLADRAAAAALSGPAVSPGQWFYKEYADGPGRPLEEWATADYTSQAAYLLHTLVTCRVPAGTCRPAEVRGMPMELTAIPTGGLSYAALAALPADPRALVARLESIPPGCLKDRRPCGAFALIGQLFFAYVMPPRLAAELYRALGDIPGVTVVPDVTDSAGRSGVAFRFPVLTAAGRAYEEIIVNPDTYQFMAWEIPSSYGESGLALMAEAPVSGPGVRP